MTSRPHWYVWRSKKRMGERRWQLFRILLDPGKMGSILIEFRDGTKVVTGRHYIR